MVLFRLKSIFLALLWLGLALGHARAADIGGKIEYLEDSSRQLHIQEVIRSQNWHEVKKSPPRFGFTHSRYWLKFKLPMPPAEAQDRSKLLELNSIYVEKAQLYVVHGEQVVWTGLTGMGVPLRKRSMQRGELIFRVPASSNPDTTYYLSAESTFPLEVPLELRTHDSFASHNWKTRLLFGIFIGCFALSVIFNFFLGFALRSKLYIYYALYVFSFAFLFLASEGVLVEYAWPNSPWWALREMHVYGALTLIFYVQFIREFLQLPEWGKKINRILTALVAISTFRAVWLFYRMDQPVIEIGEVAIVLTNFLAVLVGVLALKKRLRSARYFLLSSLAFNVSYILFVLQSCHLIWISPLIRFAPHFGSLAEVILLSFALADRIRATNQDLALANKHLQEQRVAVIHAEKMSALGRMAGGIAHEINNPLSIINGRAEQLRRLANMPSPEPGLLMKIADSIEQTSFRISKTVRSMVSFSRNSAQDPLQPILVESILHDTFALCAESLRNRGITLRVEAPDEALSVHCRVGEICQVLVNLLNNARDAIEREHERWICVEVKANPAHAEFSITDSGRGIPMEIRDKIHEPFFTTKEIGKGTGLGLSISSTLVANNGGRLWLDHESSRTRFVFTVPRIDLHGGHDPGLGAKSAERIN
jgi:signal transduction histidine kinase